MNTDFFIPCSNLVLKMGLKPWQGGVGMQWAGKGSETIVTRLTWRRDLEEATQKIEDIIPEHCILTNRGKNLGASQSNAGSVWMSECRWTLPHLLLLRWSLVRKFSTLCLPGAHDYHCHTQHLHSVLGNPSLPLNTNVLFLRDWITTSILMKFVGLIKPWCHVSLGRVI